MDEIIKKFTTWFNKNKFILKAENSVLVQFSERKRIQTTLNLIVDNIFLQQNKSTKFLAIYIDNEPSWEIHVDNVLKNLNKGFYAILQLKKVFETSALIDVYYTSVCVHLVLS